MRHLYISTFFIVALFISPQAYTQSLVISNEHNQSIATGTVTNIGIEELTLQIGKDEFLTVETDDIDVDNSFFKELIAVGNNIKVIGKFDDNVLEADQIIRVSEETDILIEAN